MVPPKNVEQTMKNKDHLQESVHLVGLSTHCNMMHGAYNVRVFVQIQGQKKICKITVKSRLYPCANQLHVSAIYSHNQAEPRIVNKKNDNTM